MTRNAVFHDSGVFDDGAGTLSIQPSDSDLTAIAALTTTSFGRAFLTLADAAASRTAIGTVIGTDVEAHDPDLTTIAGLSPTNDDVLQRKAGAWTNRTMANLIADLAALGTTFQPLDSDLTSIAALSTTSFGRSLLAAADAAALRTLAGTVIGTDVQAYDTELAALAGLTSAANKLPYFTGSGTAALADLSAFARTYLDDADAATVRATLGIPAVVGGVEWTTIIAASDDSKSSTTVLVNDAELLVTPAAGTYEFQLVLVYGSPAGAGTPATPDFKIGFSEDNTLRGVWQLWYQNSADSAANTLLNVKQDSNPVCGTAAGNRIAFGLGSYVSTGAQVHLQWAQGTSDANTVIRRAGSMLRYRKIG